MGYADRFIAEFGTTRSFEFASLLVRLVLKQDHMRAWEQDFCEGLCAPEFALRGKLIRRLVFTPFPKADLMKHSCRCRSHRYWQPTHNK